MVGMLHVSWSGEPREGVCSPGGAGAGATSGGGDREVPELEVMLVGRHLLHPEELGMELGTELHPHLLEHLSPRPLLTQATQTGCQEVALPLHKAGRSTGSRAGTQKGPASDRGARSTRRGPQPRAAQEMEHQGPLSACRQGKAGKGGERSFHLKGYICPTSSHLQQLT